MSLDSTPWTLTARWVFPADQPPLPGGVITIQGDKILAVEAASARRAEVDLGNTAILPGLVNAHTHLDLSDARCRIPPRPDFTDWLRWVIKYRRQQRSEQRKQAIADGIAESMRYGVTLLGDISAGGLSWDALDCAKLRAVVFYEMLGLTSLGAEEAFIDGVNWSGTKWTWRGLSHRTLGCRPGYSPHAPYSFRADKLPIVAQWGRWIAIHLAESVAEEELLDRHTGPFVPFLAELGVWEPSGLAHSPRHIVELTSSADRVLFIHCNYLQPEAPIPAHATIVYCPRTHAAFGHPPHPFREFIKRGVRVVLGTDSLASNPDLDILAEARFVAARHPDLPGETLLRMITLDGAIALGWGDVTGSLSPRKSADLVVLPLPDREEKDPYRLVFDSSSSVQRVCFRGSWI